MVLASLIFMYCLILWNIGKYLLMFLQTSFTCKFQFRDSSNIRPRYLTELTLFISLLPNSNLSGICLYPHLFDLKITKQVFFCVCLI